INGNNVQHLYLPSRVLWAAIPIKEIVPTNQKIFPFTWTEPLYVEFFLEFGGYNLLDLMKFQAASSGRQEIVQSLKRYLQRISILHPIFDDIDWSSDTYIYSFIERLMLKHYYDSQVEASFLIPSYPLNRTHQNFTILGDQDLDDCQIIDNNEHNKNLKK